MGSQSSRGSVTRLYQGLREGDNDAASELWLRYFARTVSVARTRLGNLPRQARDEEDVALSAFKSLCRGVQRGCLPPSLDRASLWRVLVTITARKAADQWNHECRQKRDFARASENLPAREPGDSTSGSDLFRQLLSREPSPALAAQLTEEVTRLLDALPRMELREIALLKMEGYTNEEISERLGRGLATIARKLRTIRELWGEIA